MDVHEYLFVFLVRGRDDGFEGVEGQLVRCAGLAVVNALDEVDLIGQPFTPVNTGPAKNNRAAASVALSMGRALPKTRHQVATSPVEHGSANGHRPRVGRRTDGAEPSVGHHYFGIGDRDGPLPVHDGQLLARMDRDGLIRRTPAEHDRRVSLISLTETGRAKLTQVRSALFETNDQALRGFSTDEVALLLDLLRKLVTNLDEADSPASTEDQTPG